jgi:hypothetical protein
MRGVLALVGTAVTLGYGWYRAAVTEMQAALNKTETAAEREAMELLALATGVAVNLISAHPLFS